MIKFFQTSRKVSQRDHFPQNHGEMKGMIGGLNDRHIRNNEEETGNCELTLDVLINRKWT